MAPLASKVVGTNVRCLRFCPPYSNDERWRWQFRKAGNLLSPLQEVELKAEKVTPDTAMIRKRRIRIISISEQSVVIRRGVASEPTWCEVCFKGARMVTPDEAAAFAQVNTRTIYRWVEAGSIHFTEEPEGVLLVCVDSLPLNL